MMAKEIKKKPLGRPKGSKNQKPAAWPPEVYAHLNLVEKYVDLSNRVARLETLLGMPMSKA